MYTYIYTYICIYGCSKYRCVGAVSAILCCAVQYSFCCSVFCVFVCVVFCVLVCVGALQGCFVCFGMFWCCTGFCIFCRILSLLQGSFAKETFNFKEPTNRSNPICLHQNQRGYPCWCFFSLLQNIVSFMGLFCKRDLYFLSLLVSSLSLSVAFTRTHTRCAYTHTHKFSHSSVLPLVLSFHLSFSLSLAVPRLFFCSGSFSHSLTHSRSFFNPLSRSPSPLLPPPPQPDKRTSLVTYMNQSRHATV